MTVKIEIPGKEIRIIENVDLRVISSRVAGMGGKVTIVEEETEKKVNVA